MGASQDTVLIVGAGIAGAAAAVALHKVRADVGALHASVFILFRPERGWQCPSGVCKAGGRSGASDREGGPPAHRRQGHHDSDQRLESAGPPGSAGPAEPRLSSCQGVSPGSQPATINIRL